jgi:V/A-type H+-transporting ATPase subunit E
MTTGEVCTGTREMAMTRTLGDITTELKEKVLSPAKEEAEKMMKEARSQADSIIMEARKEASRIREEAKHHADTTIKQMEVDMGAAARNFILLVQERLEQAIVRPLVEDEIKAVLGDKDFLSSIIVILITEFARVHGKENKIEILLPDKQKEALEEWFVNKFLQKAAGGLVVHFSDKVAFGFRLGIGESGTYFNFEDGFIEVFSEFCSPRFRKYFFAPGEGS